jgi:hypothetical protein
MITAKDAKLSAFDVVLDVWHPTSTMLDRSDAMNPEPGCSGANVSSQLEGQMTEDVEHLHEHVLDPVVIDGGRYRVSSRPGDGAQMQPETLFRFAFVAGAEWGHREGVVA